jgi:hypothetical protein
VSKRGKIRPEEHPNYDNNEKENSALYNEQKGGYRKR